VQLQRNPWIVRLLLLGLTFGVPTSVAQQQLTIVDCLSTVSPVVGLWIWLWPYWRPQWTPSPPA
jgi:hypothetical protein